MTGHSTGFTPRLVFQIQRMLKKFLIRWLRVSFPLNTSISLALTSILPEFKACVNAFKVARQVCGGCDLVEEHLSAGVWPLSPGWFPVRMRQVKFDFLGDEIVCPVFGVENLMAKVMKSSSLSSNELLWSF
jgi:hypothetical protein